MILRRTIVSLLLALAATGADAALPTPPPGELSRVDSTFDTALTRILHLSESGRYDAAFAVCDSLRQALPDHPGPYLTTAGVYVSWMQSYRLNDFQSEVDDNAQRAIDTGTQLLASKPDALLSFYVGSAYGYRALSRLRRHNWIGALLDGRRSNEHLKTAVKLDPQLYDAYFALGGYHYWRTARSTFIRSVAFWMPDRRELGLQQMQLAVDHGRYVQTSALHGLALARLDAGDIDGALVANTQVIAMVDPPTNGSLYTRGRLLAQLQDWPGVEQTFTRLLARLTPRSVGYQVECMYWIARALTAQGRPDEARKLVDAAWEQNARRQAEEEIESALESYDTILQWLQALTDSLASTSGSAPSK
jgi:tetratricopeptide (TPR) repeat protein